ncbi:hypothetical protein [Sphingobacterium paucimobilis]|uniref:Uncharacterized protein n=1 Tax=Sphingobacterium paucimobilis HER1398 TaxID=1346330 RepID=U2J8P4_9SPHI|nr:hypothetical protein [Sphingobacterium paucimobilis]ERJ61309.1 hypothetical protein M472_21375 [Sphingobacterium paucimobilis HER1398]
MNLFKPDQWTCFKVRWNRIITSVLRVFLVLTITAITALVTNLGYKAVEGELQVGAGLWILLLGTMMLHIIYAVWVSIVYRLLFGRLSDIPKWLKTALYLFAAVIPPVLMHVVLLQILVFSQMGMLYNTSYWITDFPFFAVPLLLYILVVCYWPKASLLPQGRMTDRDSRAKNFMNSWIGSRKMFFLMSYLDLIYGSSVVYQDHKVRIKDILVITFEEGVYFFILRDGTKIATSLNSVDIDKWLLANWFLTTSRWTYVNMLYVQEPEVGDKYLKLTYSVNEQIKETPNYAKIKAALPINRKQQPKLDEFVLHKESLSHEGWDEMIEL